MASAYKTWRLERRAAAFWSKAQTRSAVLPRGELIEYLDTTLMTAGQAVSRYRRSENLDERENYLYELRMQLEAALGMTDNLLSPQSPAPIP